MLKGSEFASLRTMEDHAKEAFGETFPTRAEMYEDAFRHGCYHEEEPAWWVIGSKLSDEDIGNLTLSAIRAVIHRADIQEVMRFHDAFAAFLGNTQKSRSEFFEMIQLLENFRTTLFRAGKGSNSWFIADAIRAFSLVEFAIENRIGVWASPVAAQYDKALREVFESAK